MRWGGWKRATDGQQRLFPGRRFCLDARMRMRISRRGSAGRPALAALRAACRGLVFQKHDIARHLDERGRYLLPLDREFPFHIALFHLRSGQFTPTWNWHERLELTVPLDGPLRMRMGGQTVTVGPGELLVVDNLKLHNYEDFPGFNTRVITLTFLPEFIYLPGSPACDYAFLLPFYAKRDGHPHLLRADDELAAPVTRALTELLGCYFGPGDRAHAQCGCKVGFLQILYHLTRRFQTVEVMRSEFVQRRQQAARLARLFEFVRMNYGEPVSVTEAARLVHLSAPQFMKLFRKVSGMTFVAFVTRVRLTNAQRMLRETDRTIAEIAARTGFSDQSYFDRRFKQTFGKTPRQYRADLRAAPADS
jgi:AraC family transcriptional regulator, transcriptional activator of pobA